MQAEQPLRRGKPGSRAHRQDVARAPARGTVASCIRIHRKDKHIAKCYCSNFTSLTQRLVVGTYFICVRVKILLCDWVLLWVFYGARANNLDTAKKGKQVAGGGWRVRGCGSGSGVGGWAAPASTTLTQGTTRTQRSRQFGGRAGGVVVILVLVADVCSTQLSMCPPQRVKSATPSQREASE